MEDLTALSRKLAELEGITPAMAVAKIVSAGSAAWQIEQRFAEAAAQSKEKANSNE